MSDEAVIQLSISEGDLDLVVVCRKRRAERAQSFKHTEQIRMIARVMIGEPTVHSRRAARRAPAINVEGRRRTEG